MLKKCWWKPNNTKMFVNTFVKKSTLNHVYNTKKKTSLILTRKNGFWKEKLLTTLKKFKLKNKKLLINITTRLAWKVSYFVVLDWAPAFSFSILIFFKFSFTTNHSFYFLKFKMLKNINLRPIYFFNMI